MAQPTHTRDRAPEDAHAQRERGSARRAALVRRGAPRREAFTRAALHRIDRRRFERRRRVQAWVMQVCMMQVCMMQVWVMQNLAVHGRELHGGEGQRPAHRGARRQGGVHLSRTQRSVRRRGRQRSRHDAAHRAANPSRARHYRHYRHYRRLPSLARRAHALASSRPRRAVSRWPDGAGLPHMLASPAARARVGPAIAGRATGCSSSRLAPKSGQERAGEGRQ